MKERPTERSRGKADQRPEVCRSRVTLPNCFQLSPGLALQVVDSGTFAEVITKVIQSPACEVPQPHTLSVQGTV